MTSRYDQPVNPDLPNNAHSIAVRMVGWNQRVLELGAAGGHVTKTLAARNCQVTAVEYDAEALPALKEVTEHVVIGDLNDPATLDDLSGEFDVVLAGDVLEHLLDPDRVLRQAVALLAPAGRVIVSLPNVAHADVRLALLQGRWEYRGYGLLDATHIKFFTYASMNTLIRQAGLVLLDLERVRRPAFETELGVDRSRVPTAVLDHILQDPEAETYQFVFTAARDDDEGRMAELSERNEALRQERDRAVTELAVHQIRQRELADRLAHLEKKAAGLARQRNRARRELQQFRAHPLVRYGSSARSLLRRLRPDT